MEIRVRRWTTRVRVPPALADRPWRTWCEQLVRGPVGRRWLEQLEGLVPPGADLGSTDDAVVIVRQLALRVRVRGEATEAAMAEGWSRGLSEALTRSLAEAAPVGGGVPGRASERVAVFPSSLAAEVAALRVRGRALEPWWVERILQQRATAEVVAGWIATRPGEAPRAVLDATDGRPAVLATWVDPTSAAALTEALTAAWEGRPSWVAPRPDPADGAVAPEHLALLLACEARLPGVPPVSTVRGPPTEVPPTLERIVAAPEPEPVDRDTGDADADRVPLAEVDLGGLLLLLGPLLRHPVLADQPWTVWPGHLAAIAHAVDQALFDRVEPTLADRIRDANSPVLDAFTTRWPPPEPTLAPDLARRVLRDLLGELSDPVRPIPVPGDRLARALSPPPPPWDALHAVVVRPGRLRLTDTHADLFLPPDAVDVSLRRVGWDLDPGFVPGLRRVVRFHYGPRS